jgi:hypothetical protein
VLLEVAQTGLERHHFRQPQGLVRPFGQERVRLFGKGERAVPVALFLQGLLGGFDEQLEVVDLRRQLGVGRVGGGILMYWVWTAGGAGGTAGTGGGAVTAATPDAAKAARSALQRVKRPPTVRTLTQWLSSLTSFS